MRGYRFLFMLFLVAAFLLGMVVVAIYGDSDSQIEPRLTTTPSQTFTPGGPTETPTLTATPTWTVDPEITVVSSPTPTPTPYFELLVNGGFEEEDSVDPDQARGWAAADVSKDKRKCEAEKAYAGECYYQFKNGEDEKSSLTQDVPLTAPLSQGTELWLTGAYIAKGDPLVKIRVYITYDSLPEDKMTVKLKGITYNVYQAFFSQPLETAAAATRIQVVVLNKGAYGKVLLDDLQLLSSEGGVQLVGLP
jgi:hypothetical protein